MWCLETLVRLNEEHYQRWLRKQQPQPKPEPKEEPANTTEKAVKVV